MHNDGSHVSLNFSRIEIYLFTKVNTHKKIFSNLIFIGIGCFCFKQNLTFLKSLVLVCILHWSTSSCSKLSVLAAILKLEVLDLVTRCLELCCVLLLIWDWLGLLQGNGKVRIKKRESTMMREDGWNELDWLQWCSVQ